MKIRWKEFLLALVMAFALWFGMSGTEVVESQVDVRVDYKGIPKDLVIRGNGLVSKVSVRVRGPIGQIRAMGARDYVFAMDLSSLKKGENTLPISVGQLGIFGGLQVIDVTPPVIRVDVDSLEVKMIPLKALLQGEVPEGYVAEVILAPKEVAVRGASQELDNLQEVEVPVTLGDIQGPSLRDSTVVLPLPPGLESSPAQVTASVHVDIKRKLVHVTRTVKAEVSASLGIYVRPAKVKISIYMPEALASSAGDSKDIRAFVTVPERQLGTYTLPVRVALPEGAKLGVIDPEEVSVTLEQKN